MYIFWFLHQTTTNVSVLFLCACCISFDSYIKPQLKTEIIKFIISCISFDSYIKPQLQPFVILLRVSCISFDSYIKPQLRIPNRVIKKVVYLLIPTSNHNSSHVYCAGWRVVYLLIPTSNHNSIKYSENQFKLYIFWFLHQTTTRLDLTKVLLRCISFDSYIKPQLEQVL